MPVDIFPTTAENVIAATDAVLTRMQGCDENYVAEFMDVPLTNARNALGMATELGLVGLQANGNYCPQKPFAIYLVTARDSQKAAVLRLVLENYAPYQAFKFRLAVTGLASTAAEQIKVMYSFQRHRDEIKDTLISLGTFAQSLVTEGGGLFKPAEFDTKKAGFIEIASEVALDRALAETKIRSRLGNETADWINYQEVFTPLTTAFQELRSENSRTSIVFAGNAIESFLVQLGTHHSVNLTGATGINSKVEKFNGTQIRTKHKNMFKYLGHIRNAADHGVDTEIGTSWTVTHETAIEYVNVSLSTVKAVTLTVLNLGYTV
ncbi:MAG: hypothetical protein KJZ77_15785 [Anaerolineales bacterium]|nr:hypothetical protein [Anaerolineales bacterium]